MIWVCVTQKSSGKLVKIDVKMKAARYQKLLEKKFALISSKAEHVTCWDVLGKHQSKLTYH